ncbi:MAG: tRNA(Ile)(2)-agmatinylcytidine synthase [Nitrososphaerales archaeon]
MFTVHLGLDDTDSKKGMCTTYLANLLVREILSEGCEFIDYPNLIRLNPAIPWKTRGNGAIALRFKCHDPERIFQLACKLLKENSHFMLGANPCLVLLEGSFIPYNLRKLAEEALYKVINFKRAKRLAEELNLRVYTLRKGHGLIGAISALGNTLQGDHTYELMVYRKKEFFGKERRVDKLSVKLMDKETYPLTFNNYDYEKERVLITPRSPDPVLLGIRGENPKILLKAFQLLKIEEEWDSYIIYRTNQGTNAHLKNHLDLSQLKAYTSGFVRGRLISNPRKIEGGHVLFEIKNEEGGILCAVYEPTGSLNKIASKLLKGDEVELGGSVRKNTVRYPKTLNVEYIKIIKLARLVRVQNPLCDTCNRRMKSLGKNQGFGCEKCKLRKFSRLEEELERDLKPGLYLPPPRAHRHLTKPLQRYNKRKLNQEFKLESWYFFREPIRKLFMK